MYEYAQAPLHFQVSDETERGEREVEAEAVAYVVGRYYGLDTWITAVYLVARTEDDIETVTNQLQRISQTAAELINTAEQQL